MVHDAFGILQGKILFCFFDVTLSNLAIVTGS